VWKTGVNRLAPWHPPSPAVKLLLGEWGHFPPPLLSVESTALPLTSVHNVNEVDSSDFEGLELDDD
jgi:hypothetical protein